jgi:uncharacterized membrane protein YfcA
MSLIAPIVIGAIVGLLLGFLGGGGAIMIVPAMVYVLHADEHVALATALIIVAVNAAIGGTLAWKDGRADSATAAIFGASGMATAYGGAIISKQIPGHYLLVAFSILLLTIAFFMYRGTLRSPGEPPPLHRPRWQIIGVGALVGLVTGILGVGGGFVIVPAMVLLVGMPMRRAVGTSLLVITINSIASLLGHLDTPFNWQLIGLLLAGAIPAMAVANRYGGAINQIKLRRGFAIFVTVVACFMLAETLLFA